MAIVLPANCAVAFKTTGVFLEARCPVALLPSRLNLGGKFAGPHRFDDRPTRPVGVRVGPNFLDRNRLETESKGRQLDKLFIVCLTNERSWRKIGEIFGYGVLKMSDNRLKRRDLFALLAAGPAALSAISALAAGEDAAGVGRQGPHAVG